MPHPEPLPPPDERTAADWQRFYLRRYVAAIRASLASEERGDPPGEAARILAEVLSCEDDSDPEALRVPRGPSGNA